MPMFVCNRNINEDGKGEGTVINTGSRNTCQVKWDHDGSEIWYYQGSWGIFSLKLAEQKTLERKKKLGEILFKEKELVDAKIICEGKTFECHKIVLSSRSDVFATMFKNKSMSEAQSGVVEIDDFKADVIEAMIDFIYNDEIKEKKKITANLLRAAEKYNIGDLVEFCIEHLKTNLSLDSVLDVLVVAHLINEKELFDAASDFFKKNSDSVVKTKDWEELKETNPSLIGSVFSKIFNL